MLRLWTAYIYSRNHTHKEARMLSHNATLDLKYLHGLQISQKRKKEHRRMFRDISEGFADTFNIPGMFLLMR